MVKGNFSNMNNCNSSGLDEDAYASQYLDEYLDYCTNTSDEVTYHISLLHDIGSKLEDVLLQLDNFYQVLVAKGSDPIIRRKMLILAQNTSIQAQELGDSKLQHWQHILDIIENKSRTLENGKNRLDIGRENDPHNENHKSESQPERSSKRSRRQRNIDVNLRDDSLHEKPEKELQTSTTCKKQKKKKRKTKAEKEHVASPFEPPIDPDEPTYCLCDQVSFGEMICCDNQNCPREWFHFSCVGLTFKPKGKWYCPKCRGERSNQMKQPGS